MNADVKVELENSVALFAASAGSTKGTVIGDLAKLILEIVEKHVGIDVDEMAAFVGELYDKYVAPLDLPGVPEAMEGMVDKILKATLESIIKKALNNLKVQ